MSPMLDRMVSIIVVETTHKRADAVRDIGLGIVTPAMALGGLTFGLLAWGIRQGLAPLRDVAAAVAQRAPHDWRALPLARVPAEAVPLIERINTLLGNVEQTLSVQRRFIADAAHQLRTPVTSQRVLLEDLAQELARLDADAAARCQPVLAQLRGSSDRMARLIGQLLSLARSETALALDDEHRPQDIVPLLREACEPLVLRALAAGRQVALEAPSQGVTARVHALWFGEVLVNLLDNALRYGGPHIEVTVTALPAGGAEVQVRDDGPGVPPDALPRLFEPFVTGRAEGTGLGLAVVRRVVELHGGKVTIERRHGGGSVFVLWLPPGAKEGS